ncbi:MAG: SH3 domain-containing protein [Chloroflexi bacterium]|nr:SH3 domain-containing protein [Chloroflexota bacterium]
MRNSILLLLVSSAIVLAGCDVTAASENAAPTPDFVTATLPPSPIPLPTQTPPPPTPAPTIQPIEGTAITQVNVRAEPSTAGENLGTISQFSKVQIIGRDASTSWYQVIYADSSTGTGWVRAEYVQVNATAEIPVSAAGAGGGSGVSGLVIQKINVRNGPGTSFETLGELNPNDVVFISGKDESGAWMQIEFANSADGKGWAALEFLQVENVDALPVIGGVSPAPQAAASESAANVPLPAMQDGDSMETPLAKMTIAPMNARAFQVNGEVSAPEGDAEDWVEFNSFSGAVVIQVLCSSTGLQVEVWNNGAGIEGFLLACGEERILNISPNSVYLLRLFNPASNEFRHTKYTLSVKTVR